MSGDLDVFKGTVDRYNGITIDTESESINSHFDDRLTCKTVLTLCYLVVGIQLEANIIQIIADFLI